MYQTSRKPSGSRCQRMSLFWSPLKSPVPATRHSTPRMSGLVNWPCRRVVPSMVQTTMRPEEALRQSRSHLPSGLNWPVAAICQLGSARVSGVRNSPLVRVVWFMSQATILPETAWRQTKSVWPLPFMSAVPCSFQLRSARVEGLVVVWEVMLAADIIQICIAPVVWLRKIRSGSRSWSMSPRWPVGTALTVQLTV